MPNNPHELPEDYTFSIDWSNGKDKTRLILKHPDGALQVFVPEEELATAHQQGVEAERERIKKGLENKTYLVELDENDVKNETWSSVYSIRDVVPLLYPEIARSKALTERETE